MRTSKDDFEEFVVVCSDRLLGTAYLLTRDGELAEELLDTALTRAWFGWGHLEEQPEPYVRRVMANEYTTWWRRRWGHQGRRRQRAVVVLRYFDDLSVDDTAETLGYSHATVQRLEASGLKQVDVDGLREEAAGLDASVTPQARAERVVRRVQSTGGAGAAASVRPSPWPSSPRWPPSSSYPRSCPNRRRRRPCRTTGWSPRPPSWRASRWHRRSPCAARPTPTTGARRPARATDLLRVAVAPSPDRQVIGWATTVGTSSVVVVSVDGKVVARGPGGSFDYGFPLAPDATHLVVVRVLRPEAAKKMGLVIYGPGPLLGPLPGIPVRDPTSAG